MKKLSRFIVAGIFMNLGFIFLSTLVYSYTSNPGTQYSGSPLDGRSCSSCHHTSGVLSSIAINLTGLPAQWAPNTTYRLNLTITGGSSGVYGYELSAENASAKQGTLTNVTNSAVSGSYIFHAANGGTYSFDYKTPAAGAGTITFYICAVRGRNINTKSYAVSEQASSPVSPAITSQPVNKTVVAGQTAAFSVTANGTAPLTYQWQKAPNGSGTFANISGATSANYTTPSTVTGDSGATFRCVVTNSAGSITSNAATLTVNAAVVAPTVTTQPVNKTVVAGQTAAFSVTANGTAPLTYQWQKAPNGSATFTNISAAASASYTTPVTVTSDSGTTFRCVVTNAGGSATSSAATLTVTAAPPTPHPADANADFLVNITEATKYGTCWKNSAAFADCPVGIAMDYAVRAGTLWIATVDGRYLFVSDMAKPCPLCWESKP